MLDSPELREIIKKYSRFLVEVRKRIIFTLIVFALASVFGFLFYEDIIKFLINILNLKGVNIVFTSPFQFINLAVSCGLGTGLVLIFPLIVSQFLFFLKPALRDKEYKMLVRFLPFSLFLFLLGFSLGGLIMKWQIEIFLDKTISLGIGNVLDISKLLTTVLLTAVLMGISFQFPILLLLLLRLGIVKRQFLSKSRKFVYLVSLIFAVFLPPDSILADIILALPLVFMFEVTLLIDRVSRRA